MKISKITFVVAIEEIAKPAPYCGGAENRYLYPLGQILATPFPIATPKWLKKYPKAPLRPKAFPTMHSLSPLG